MLIAIQVKPKKGKKKERLQDDVSDESDDEIPVISKQGQPFCATDWLEFY